MSTTTAYDDVSSASQSGSGSSWTNILTLATNTSGAAYVENDGSLTTIKTVTLKIPDFMTSILAGSEFVSLSVKFKAYVSSVESGAYFYFRTYQNSVQVYEQDVESTSTSFYTITKTAAQWGFSGTAQAIIEDLADGSIDWRFAAAGSVGNWVRFDLKEFQVQLTYREPDTLRASIIACIP